VLAPYTQNLLSGSQGEQKKVQNALQEAAVALLDLNYDDAEMNQIVTSLQSSVSKTLQASWKGTEITKTYVESNYAQDINQTKTLYSNLSSDDRSQLKSDIVNSMSLDALLVLYDYFLEG
jgi:hypothetical protein